MGLTFTLLAWGLLVLLLAWLSHGWLDRKANPNRAPAVRMSDTGSREVVLERNRAGHYVVDGLINGHPVTFLLDTGATVVAVDERLAHRVGLEKGPRISLQTANGTVEGWHTLIASVDVGGLAKHAIPAAIQPGLGDSVLLGMSFLKRIEFAQRDNMLILRDGD